MTDVWRVVWAPQRYVVCKVPQKMGSRHFSSSRLVQLSRLAREVAAIHKLPSKTGPGLCDKSDYVMDSTYRRTDGNYRGFCNWLIRDLVVVGRYPFCDPTMGPSVEESRAHLRRLLEAGITSFVCLQSEVPAQTEVDAWPVDGITIEALPNVHPTQAAGNGQFCKGAFHEYRTALLQEAADLHIRAPSFLHFPIDDMGVPSWDDLLCVLNAVLQELSKKDECVYIHCWGGMGRAGVVGASLLAALQPHLGPEEVLICTQAAYDSRAGGKGRQSPQTWQQRAIVRDFCLRLKEVSAELH